MYEERDIRSVFRVINSKTNIAFPEKELDVWMEVLLEVFQALNEANPISEEQIRDWRERLYPPHSDEPPVWFRRIPSWREVLTDLDQIRRVQSVDFFNDRSINL